MPRCSVIIPTYNRRRLLEYTLTSLTRQSLPRDEFEVLVVDDGSADGTGEMVQGFADRFDLRYFFQADTGSRAAAARNLGITEARSDICVFLDDGVIAHSGCLRAHVDTHEAHAGPVAVIGYAYCLLLHERESGRMNRTLDYADADGSIALVRERGLWPDIREDFYAKYGDDFGDLPAPWVVYFTCNTSANTDQVRAVGMFDESFEGWGGEDLDLGYRLHRAGARIVLNRDAASLHVPHPLASRAREAANYRYMVEKYGTPIMSLMPGFSTLEVHPLNINDIIRERGLPSCAEYELQRR
ncbi:MULTISPECIES: glycosyltransferase [unclassified Solwaraspora]|uniref:glycosyltransferase n=1 Tax=unclassified Solwaraspora TaxID=2627926 RepID=UPI00259B6DC9|nr:glycosyltransferase [Solwaraspora sp. WMMA2056]WJK38633.1 glycosyltransferase [Solwaraspora sp. WMMA2056]